MAENKSIIGSVNVTSTQIKCPGCGTSIGIQFDPSTATLTCPFCGLSSKLAAAQKGAVAEELDFNSAIQRASVDWGKYKKLIVCSNCGGQSVYDTEQVTGACPFCGSTSVAPAAEIDQIMAPNAIIPFSVGREQVQDLFVNYAKKKTLVNKKVLNCKLENLVGIYVPYWTFDAFTASFYDAYRNLGQAGYVPANGNWYQYIDDIPVFASARLRHPFISKVQTFDFTKAVPYSPEYLAGIPAERYTFGLNDSWEYVKTQITKILKKSVHRFNRDLRVDDIFTRYYDVKFRYVLAPIYLATYKFGKLTFPVAINGQTGETYCDVPTHIKKLIILAIIAFIVASVLRLIARDLTDQGLVKDCVDRSRNRRNEIDKCLFQMTADLQCPEIDRVQEAGHMDPHGHISQHGRGRKDNDIDQQILRFVYHRKDHDCAQKLKDRILGDNIAELFDSGKEP